MAIKLKPAVQGAGPDVATLEHAGAKPVAKAAQAKAKITQETKDANGVVEQTSTEETAGEVEIIPAHLLMQVGVNASRTLPTGKYQSVKLGVFVTVPCKMGDHEEAFEFAAAWVNEKMNELVDGIEVTTE